MRAVGTGGIFGKGWLQGPLTNGRDIPVIWADFPFAALGEQFGLVGCAAVLLSFGIVLVRIWRIASLSRDMFGTYLCAGVFTMLLWQVFQNVGMTIKIMPVTGLPMPFISYGGSSLITWFALLGLVQSVHMRRMRMSAPASSQAHGCGMSALRRRAVTTGYGLARGRAHDRRDSGTRIETLLGQVQKPARYIGCEDGAVTPRHGPGKVSWLLAYPDAYEVGLPNQGLQILYEILNERADAVAERTYAPWTDLSPLLRRHGVPLFSVDTHRAAGDFDLLAFNLSSELVFTNVLEMIDLAGVPVRAADRRPEHPLVVVGGHSAFNPEPLADFVDLVVLGEGEEVVGEITEVVGAWIRGGRADRDAVLRDLAQVPGVYVPSMYEVDLRRPGDRRRSRRGSPTSRRPSTSARSPTWGSGRTRSTSSCR